jgi:hypothetical protein
MGSIHRVHPLALPFHLIGALDLLLLTVELGMQCLDRGIVHRRHVALHFGPQGANDLDQRLARDPEVASHFVHALLLYQG